MTSWTGTARTRTRRSTRTAFWNNGTTKTTPGPFPPLNPPTVKTSKRSYSRSAEIPKYAMPRTSKLASRITKELLLLNIETSLSALLQGCAHLRVPARASGTILDKSWAQRVLRPPPVVLEHHGSQCDRPKVQQVQRPQQQANAVDGEIGHERCQRHAKEHRAPRHPALPKEKRC